MTMMVVVVMFLRSKEAAVWQSKRMGLFSLVGSV